MVAEATTPAEAVTDAVEATTTAATKQVAAVAAVAKGASKAAKTRTTKARKTRRTATKRAKAKTVKTVRAAKVRAKQGIEDMTNDTVFTGFAGIPGANTFEKLFTDASGRGEDVVKRSRKAAEELADMYRGNIDAFVEASRIAATGVQSIGQTVAAKSRDSVEQTADTVRSFAEAKSPTELLQLQGDFARSAFDRMVQDSSTFAESMVKLAGEAFQPLSNRASANVERINEIAA
ncbi:phasin family protein [Sphingomonas sabuli]|uniref:Phasin family protein n=1 Tax=Sphingomonas sabuli TaxID=2764186 RepID=A0A7G9L0P1_9SPHN|nr:phasin family protein [Sphingomonas sabuli]QNM82190.1 phasin family protein [Sphingomonas sabuli]